MQYNQYESELMEELTRMNPEAEVALNPVLQNNGVERMALLIMREENHCVPVIYLSSLYDHFCRNGLTVRESAEYTMDLYKVIMENLNQDCQIEKDLMDFERIKDHLTVKMVNREKNEKLLEEVISIPFQNLSGILYVADSLKTMTAGVKVTRSLAQLWDVSVGKICETALENLSSYGNYQMREIGEVLSEFPEYRFSQDVTGTTGLYVITDVSRRNGPSVLLFPEILGRMAEELNDDLLLLPSSIYEMMVLRATDADSEGLLQIVREINASVVSEEEFLGDCVYEYSRELSEVTMIS